jgi:hypothetical protein
MRNLGGPKWYVRGFRLVTKEIIFLIVLELVIFMGLSLYPLLK